MSWGRTDYRKSTALTDIFDRDEERVADTCVSNLLGFVEQIKDPKPRGECVDRIKKDWADEPEVLKKFIEVYKHKERLRSIHQDFKKYLPKKKTKVVVQDSEDE